MQEEMATLAGHNVVLNGLTGRVEIICCDILSLRRRFPASSFDLVVANPPLSQTGDRQDKPEERQGQGASRDHRDPRRFPGDGQIPGKSHRDDRLHLPPGSPCRVLRCGRWPEAGAFAAADGPREFRGRCPDGASGTGQGEEGGPGSPAAALRLRSGRGVQRGSEEGPQRPGSLGEAEKVRFSCSRTRMKVVRLVSSFSARAPT